MRHAAISLTLLAWLSAVALGCAGDATSHSGDADAGEQYGDDDLFATADGVHVRETTPLGRLEGKVVKKTREFLGIAYALPPVGALRFAPPVPAKAWRGVRDATKVGPVCPQPTIGPWASDAPMDEDCLTLNVYAPEPRPKKPLPVIAYLHGGAFVFGSSRQIDGSKLSAAGPSVVVTLNYRLGPLGFFAHPALDALRAGVPSGDDGLRDQQEALRWIRNNVAAFGGDPKNVTLAGYSTGSTSVCFHMLSPSSQDLAARWIMQSNECVEVNSALEKSDAAALATELGDAFCPDQTGPALIDCLRAQDALELAAFGSEETIPPEASGLAPNGITGWGPVIGGPNGVLPASAADLLAGGHYDSTPLIIGSTKREAAELQLVGLVREYNQQELELYCINNFYPYSSEVLARYRADDDAEANESFIRMRTDLVERCPTRTLARALSAQGRQVFLYSFEEGDAIHGDDFWYLFADAGSSQSPYDPALVELIQGYWSRFAKSGDPNGGGAPEWPLYMEASDQHMILTTMPAVGEGLSKDDCDFWDDIAREHSDFRWN